MRALRPMRLAVVGAALFAGATGIAYAAHAVTGSASAGAARIKPGPLRPGTYATASFKPPLSFAVNAGWTTVAPESPTFVSIARQDGVLVAFLRIVRVVDPNRAFTSALPASAILPAPRNMVAWLQHHPHLRAGKPVPVTVDGVRGVRIDTTVVSGYRARGCPRACVLLYLIAPGLPVSARLGDEVRSYFFKLHGETLSIGIVVPSRVFRRLVRQGDQVVSTVRFRR